MIERHPLQPFLPANAKVLFLGSPLAFEKKAEAYRRMFEEVLSCQQCHKQ